MYFSDISALFVSSDCYDVLLFVSHVFTLKIKDRSTLCKTGKYKFFIYLKNNITYCQQNYSYHVSIHLMEA